MVYLSNQPDPQNQQTEFPLLIDPALLRSAQRIYRAYRILHSKLNKHPFGVAIDRDTHRGQIIFKVKPILLPGECFVPLKQLEVEIY